jgi:hypothetical protein
MYFLLHLKSIEKKRKEKERKEWKRKGWPSQTLLTLL